MKISQSLRKPRNCEISHFTPMKTSSNSWMTEIKGQNSDCDMDFEDEGNKYNHLNLHIIIKVFLAGISGDLSYNLQLKTNNIPISNIFHTKRCFTFSWTGFWFNESPLIFSINKNQAKLFSHTFNTIIKASILKFSFPTSLNISC